MPNIYTGRVYVLLCDRVIVTEVSANWKYVPLCVAVTFPFWQAENWTSQGDWFTLNDHGFVTILQPGLYMVYAQVTNCAMCVSTASVS